MQTADGDVQVKVHFEFHPAVSNQSVSVSEVVRVVPKKEKAAQACLLVGAATDLLESHMMQAPMLAAEPEPQAGTGWQYS